MKTKDEALQMALEALEYSKSYLDELADVHGTSKKAKPGSTCPVFDNCKGRGCGLTDKDGKPLYYIHKRCPLHGAKEGEKE